MNYKFDVSSALDENHGAADILLDPIRRGGSTWIPESTSVDSQSWWQVKKKKTRKRPVTLNFDRSVFSRFVSECLKLRVIA